MRAAGAVTLVRTGGKSFSCNHFEQAVSRGEPVGGRSGAMF